MGIEDGEGNIRKIDNTVVDMISISSRRLGQSEAYFDASETVAGNTSRILALISDHSKINEVHEILNEISSGLLQKGLGYKEEVKP